ncbi:MAG TPA: hypothetical protein ENG50_05515 [Candidatus Altiarchaeales archaeon]|nr:MAG: hypothetical protein DRO65_00535 [Candidatus Altiarchaeales archaeon]HDN83804.1 hypothetical protein [Candidatus Altiarchaeales archaeon]
MKVISSKPITIAEAREILERKEKEYEKEGKKLLYEQRRALEHSRISAKLSYKDAKELYEKLKNLDLNLNDGQIVKIIDLLPETVDDVRAIFAKERFMYSEEDIRKILDLVDQYR